MQHTVPTWNYATVHVYGIPTLVDDLLALKEIVLDTTRKYESSMPKPWTLPLSGSELDATLKAIIGFSIQITRIEAKFKLGQNRSGEDQESMLAALRQSSDPENRKLAEFIAAERKAS
jgi:transcriptional regulator